MGVVYEICNNNNNVITIEATETSTFEWAYTVFELISLYCLHDSSIP